MKKGILLSVLLLVFGAGFGQTTIAVQDFETSPAAPTLTYIGGAIATGAGPYPSGDANYVSGSRGLEERNGTSTVTFAVVDASSYTDVGLSFRLASFAGTSGNGSDGGDEVEVFISDDGGATWSSELEIEGNSNAKWSFDSGTGSISEMYDGNNSPVIYAPSGGGYRTSDGYSYISLTDLPAVSNLRVRIVMNNNSNNEYWIIDDILIQGVLATTDTELNFASSTYSVSENGTSVDLCVDITNPSSGAATTADIVLTSTNTPHLTYTTTTLTFPANSSTQQCVTVNVADNANCGDATDYTFEIQNVNGGTNATAGSTNQTTLSVSDDDATNATVFLQDFDGGASNWAYTEYDENNEARFEIVNTLTNINYANIAGNFWGINDANDEDRIEFASVNTSGLTNMTFSFDYDVFGFESTDNMYYELFFDGIGQGQVYLTSTSMTQSVEGTVTEIIPNGTNSFYPVLYVDQNGGSDYAAWDNIKLVADQCITCSEPTTHAAFFANSPTGLTSTSANLSWTNGNGDNRIVVAKENMAISGTPTDNTTYTANTSFGNGSRIATNEYVVYNGNANTSSISNLTPGTEYYLNIFEYGCLPGAEDYLTSGVIAADTFISIPENPATFTEGCVSATSLELNWSAPTNGNFDGYLLVVRENATPHSVNSLNPSTQTFNTNYTLSPTFGSTTPNSRVLYRGTNTNTTITGLTTGTSYTFEILTYVIGASGYVYSNGTTTSETIQLLDVTSPTVNSGNTVLTTNWINPNVACFDEILVVVNETAGIDFTPTGNGSAYTANTVYSAANQVVYKGTSNTVTVSGLTNGTTYYFEIFVRNGNEWSAGVEVSGIPNTATVLEPGDLAIVALNTQYLSSGSDDEVCFFAFKDITEGTAIDFTDNGFERVNPNQWGDTEGTIRLERTGGGTIAKGTVICFQGEGNSSADFDVIVCGSNDNANWNISSINGSNSFYNLNSADQIWIMQNGAWSNPSGNHNATYSGNVLFGWTAIGWEPNPGYASTAGSTLPSGTDCINTDLTGITAPDKGKYTGPTTQASQRVWLERINNVNNWTGYSSNGNYNSGGIDYSGTCHTFDIGSGGFSPGYWEGDFDNNWFNCSNWQDLKVPDASVDVVINASANNEAEIDDQAPSANLYNNTATCNSLTIEDGIWVQVKDATDSLIVETDLTIEYNGFGGVLYNDEGGTVVVNGNLTIQDGALLDMHPYTGGTNSTLVLGGNWVDNNTTDNNNTGFYEDDSEVILIGGATQTLTDAFGIENFHNLTLSKTSEAAINLNDNVEVENVLEFDLGGVIVTGVNEVYSSNPSVNAIVGYNAPNTTGVYTNDKYVIGNLAREINSAAAYTFPVGAATNATGYNPVVLTVNSGTGKAVGKFIQANPGTITVNETSLSCSGTPVIIDYTTMTGLGYWNFESATTFGYDIMLHPNVANTNTDPNSDGKYRALKAPSGTAGGTWPSAAGTDGDYCQVSTSYYAIPGVGYSGFSDFGIGGGTSGPALPVQFLYFNAEANGNVSELKWATATEINNQGFEIQRSTDGANFEVIGWVNGNGNSTETITYAFTDEKPKQGVNYYRLKQIDFNGDFDYTETKALQFNNELSSATFNVYPNPTSGKITLAFTGETTSNPNVKIYNLLGQVVVAKQINLLAKNGAAEFNISHLPQGYYNLVVETENGQQSYKILKQ